MKPPFLESVCFPFLALLLALALLPGLLQAVTMTVPAVDGEEQGILTNITLSARPGTGKLALELGSSTISTDTQESIRTAIGEASRLSGKQSSKYDFDVGFGDAVGKVNGPSAGAAMALMAYSEMSGKALRRDFTITGTINKGGSIGPVGGVKAKIDAVGYDSPFAVMAVPSGQDEEGGAGILDSVYLPDYASQKYGLKVVLVSNLSIAIAIATGAVDPSTILSERQEVVAEEYSPLSATLPFRDIASRQIEAAASNGGYSNLTEIQNRSLSRLLSDARQQLFLGYYYTGANTAFLAVNAVDAKSFESMPSAQFARTAQNLQKEMGQYQFSRKTESNWEWVTSAQLRYYWAKDKLSEVMRGLDSNASMKEMSKNLALALNWFSAAKSLDNVAAADLFATGNAGTVRRETDVYNEAALLIRAVERGLNSSGLQDAEVLFHLNASREELGAGDNYAALFDAAYAYSFLFAEAKLISLASNSTDIFLDSSVLVNLTLHELASNSTFASKKSRSIWADLYYANAYYYYQQAERNSDFGSLMSAYRLAFLAGSIQIASDYARGSDFELQDNMTLDNIVSRDQGMVITIHTPKPRITPDAPSDQPEIKTRITVTPNYDYGYFQTALAAVAVLLLLLILFIATGKFLGISRPRFKTAEDLDRLFIDRKISEDNYNRLRAKYFGPGEHFSVELPAPPVSISSDEATIPPNKQEPVRVKTRKRKSRRKERK